MFAGKTFINHVSRVWIKKLFFHSVHLKIRDFVCSTCGAAFFTKSKLQYHYSKHSEVRNFACSRSICQKAFKTRSDMLQHEKTHDLGPFTCSYCSTVVTKRKEFEQHVRTCSYKPVVPRKSRSSEQIRKFTCVICSKSFKRPFHLKRHKRRQVTFLQTQCLN